jgi:hypothetical protein
MIKHYKKIKNKGDTIIYSAKLAWVIHRHSYFRVRESYVGYIGVRHFCLLNN